MSKELEKQKVESNCWEMVDVRALSNEDLDTGLDKIVNSLVSFPEDPELMSTRDRLQAQAAERWQNSLRFDQQEIELFVVTMEECAELIQECSKAIRFDSHLDSDRLAQEVGDVVCMIELLQKQGIVDPTRVAAYVEQKRKKLKKWSNLKID